tara:strand:- start:805 stop:1395 length:591 start_codon:yes stop_codon:yes gene_type:complete
MLKPALSLKALVILSCLLCVLHAYAKDTKTFSDNSYATIEWTDLMPPDDYEALMNPPEELQNIEDGSEEDQISSQIQAAITQANDNRYQEALSSTRIRSEYNHKKIRIPGFIVPLSFGENNSITEFFIVPFFGACIHVPPPPPNQIIFGKYPKGFQLEALYDPFWVEGTLSTELIENDMATAAYSMSIDKISVYTE